MGLLDSSSSAPRPIRSGGPAPFRSARDRISLEVVGGNPSVDRVHLVGRTTISVLAATLTMAIGLTIVSAAQNPIGWTLTAFAALVGLIAPWLWARLQSTRTGTTQLPIWQLAPHWAEPVAAAATKAERLAHLAERSPPGPVADHFDHLAQSAQGYVLAIHQAAVAADAATGSALNAHDPELEHDMERIVAELAELVEAAEKLRRAQRRHLETSPLAELTAQTEQLTEIIEASESDKAR